MQDLLAVFYRLNGIAETDSVFATNIASAAAALTRAAT
jgi:hypothetical protein